MNTRARRGELWALAGIAFILLVTAAWWALALWPPSEAVPEWLQVTQAACFGTRETGLPNAGGWLLLIGEPVGMLAAMLVIWKDATLGALRGLRSGAAGRAVLVLTALLLMAGAHVAGRRVVEVRRSAELPVSQPVRIGRPAPPLALVDQHGDSLMLGRFRGRQVLVTFAYGQCETVCPLVVRDALAAQRGMVEERGAAAGPVLLVITLDPWRDTPSRLAHIADAWGLGPDAFVVSGEVATVLRVLDGWEVPRTRDEATGEIVHPALVYLVDAAGRLAFRGTGATALLRAAAQADPLAG